MKSKKINEEIVNFIERIKEINIEEEEEEKNEILLRLNNIEETLEKLKRDLIG